MLPGGARFARWRPYCQFALPVPRPPTSSLDYPSAPARARARACDGLSPTLPFTFTGSFHECRDSSYSVVSSIFPLVVAHSFSLRAKFPRSCRYESVPFNVKRRQFGEFTVSSRTED